MDLITRQWTLSCLNIKDNIYINKLHSFNDNNQDDYHESSETLMERKKNSHGNIYSSNGELTNVLIGEG